MRTLTAVLGNSQRLDGGAMFGNAPKALWSRWIAPDEENRIPLACRCLLVKDGKRTILLETGIGAFFSPELKHRFGVMETQHVLLDSLAAHGVAAADVDVIVLSHLHFDHAGGLLRAWQEGEAPALAFPNASYVVSAEALARAKEPHARDRASFISELPGLLEATGKLEVIARDQQHSALLGEGYRFWHSDGHTPGLLLTEVAMPDGAVVFAADLIPGSAWVHLPITMGYDRYPELVITEKARLLADLHARGGKLFFTHDHAVAVGTVALDAKGKFSVVDAKATLPA